MANKNLLTNNSKVVSIEQAYVCPSTTTQGSTTDNIISSTYCFLSRVDPWAVESNPDMPLQSQKYLKQVQKNIFVVKRISSGDISPVIKRIDWTANTVYDFYRDDLDMTAKDTTGFPVLKFYVKNIYDQVFKCLWNNNGGVSTFEPYFEPGIYSSSNIFQAADGYKWKYMYTIDVGRKIKFIDDNWIPVVIQPTAPNPLQTSAGAGSIDVINVLSGGSGYDPTTSPINVVITGDGTGAAANVTVSAGVITDVVVTSPGTNYTYATATIQSANGANAILEIFPSPIGGHGFDPVSELGCGSVMYTCEFYKNEGGAIPTDVDFHQVGLLVNPTSLDRVIGTVPYPANSSIYETTTDLVVSPGFGVYLQDEIVYQGTSLANATFFGTVVSFDQTQNLLHMINTTGTAITSEPLYGNTSLTTRTALTLITPTFIPLSGYITYIENITGVQRSPDGIEQFKFVVNF